MIEIRNTEKQTNNSAKKFCFNKNMFYFVVLKQKKHVFL